jgi:hypothetical protein
MKARYNIHDSACSGRTLGESTSKSDLELHYLSLKSDPAGARSPPALPDHNLRTMLNILELNCWVIGDNPRHVIPVEVPSSKTTVALGYNALSRVTSPSAQITYPQVSQVTSGAAHSVSHLTTPQIRIFLQSIDPD